MHRRGVHPHDPDDAGWSELAGPAQLLDAAFRARAVRAGSDAGDSYGSMRDPRTSTALRQLAHLAEPPSPRRWQWTVARLDGAGRIPLPRHAHTALAPRDSGSTNVRALPSSTRTGGPRLDLPEDQEAAHGQVHT